MFKKTLIAMFALLALVVPAAASAASSTGAVVFSKSSKVGDEVKGGLFAVKDGRLNQLTEDPTDTEPNFSPDGRTIAFESLRDGDGEIYVVNADGSGQRRLTHNPARDFAPAWSPDGRRIAFVRDRGRGRTQRPEVYVMNADGSRQLRLVRRGRQPLWSPDGRRLAFTRGQSGGSVYVVNVDGSEERNVTRGPARDFAWSPRRAADRLQ
jgi:Tol biopolymer transport system component